MLGALLALLQVAAGPPPASEKPNIVAERLELGFKLCARHVVRQGILAPEHSEELASLDVRLLDDVPEDVRENTGPLFPQNRIFAKIGQDGANVYVSTAVNSTACRVIVADTDDGLRGRIQFVDALRQTSAWTYDQRRSGTSGGMMKDELLLANGSMIAIMNGPNTIANNGRGIQSFLTVALLPPRGPS
jgi:hypothetical protein